MAALSLSWLALAMGTTTFAQEIEVLEPAFLGYGENNLTTSNTGANPPFSGLDVNEHVGATRFYDAGFTGSRTIQANIEGGLNSNTHSTLNHNATRVLGTGALNSVQAHATWVTHAMGGRTSAAVNDPLVEQGIGFGAELWSATIATGFGGGGSFNTSAVSEASAYNAIVKTGIGGRTADVFNNSWGFFDRGNPNSAINQQIRAGFLTNTIGVDGIVNDTGAVGVFAAGNDGNLGANGVGGIGAGYNTITVGSLGSDTSNPPFRARSGFSSFGPGNVALADSATSASDMLVGVRAMVDIAAPGQNLTLAGTAGPFSYNTNLEGTSFAAPIVAGGASLVVDAGKALYGTDEAIDGRVVKAVLLNGAEKTAGWNNGQSDLNGVITTTQSLDYQVGAGALNLDRTFDQYVDVLNGGLAGTTDVLGLGSGDLGDVSAIGWDFGQVDFSGQGTNTYFIDEMLVADTLFSATLSWFIDRNAGSATNYNGAGEEHLANLNLSIFEYDRDTRGILGTIAESISVYNVVEHLAFLLPEDGWYGISISYAGSHWNFTGESAEQYGLAWYGTGVPAGVIPEPSTMLLSALGLVGVIAVARRRQSAG
jgi:hypothetical protein